MSIEGESGLKCLSLASKSPRRAELLRQIGVKFRTIHVDVPEVRGEGELPQQYVKRLAREKALAGYELDGSMPVLGADTIVECSGRLLEKPIDRNDAIEMLMSLSSKPQEVTTAIAMIYKEQVIESLSQTRVVFRDISRQEAQAYWETGEPADKAGAYAIQAMGAAFVKDMCGSYTGVVGLPIEKLIPMLQQMRIPIWQSGYTGD